MESVAFRIHVLIVRDQGEGRAVFASVRISDPVSTSADLLQAG